MAVPRQILIQGSLDEICQAVQENGFQYPLRARPAQQLAHSPCRTLAVARPACFHAHVSPFPTTTRAAPPSRRLSWNLWRPTPHTVAKPLLADGSETSHALALVYDRDGLAQLARGDLAAIRPPCVLQEFVDHGGSLFKVYVVGDVTNLTRRRSLPDMHRNGGEEERSAIARCARPLPVLSALLLPRRHKTPRMTFSPIPPSPPGAAAWRSELRGLEFVERISCIGPSKREGMGPSSYGSVGSFLEGLDEAEVEEPSWPFVRALARSLKSALGLELFNFDLIRKAGERNRFLVVDINYFPGIAKMPDYETVFADFLLYSAERKRRRCGSRTGRARARAGRSGEVSPRVV